MNPTAAEAVRDDLVERIVKTTRSAQSVPFYRRVIRQLGDGIVEEEFGELRYRMQTGEVRDPAKYFTRLLLNRVCALGKPVDAQPDGAGGSPKWVQGPIRVSHKLHIAETAPAAD